MAETLADRGFSTAPVGKWHLTAEDEMNLASTRRSWPLGRGFDRYFTQKFDLHTEQPQRPCDRASGASQAAQTATILGVLGMVFSGVPLAGRRLVSDGG